MLANRRNNVYLSFISTDLPLWNIIEGNASLYQKDFDKISFVIRTEQSTAIATDNID